MKRIYLGLSAALLSTGLIAQNSVVNREANPFMPLKKANTEKETVSNGSQKIGGVIAWSDDFSNASNWVIDNDGQTAATYGWDIGTTEGSWFFNSVINSTSDGAFAELSNGNASSGTQALDVTYTLTTAASIDIATLAGTEYVTLNYEQYGARFNDAQEVYISTNGTTWILVDDNSDKAVLSSSGGAAYTNSTKETINIQPYITGNAGTVWIRFSWTTAFPASASNPNVWITYGWMIDDVSIVTSADNDLTLDQPLFGSTGFWGAMLPYYQIPVDQITAVDFTGIVSNNGAVAQTNTIASVDVNSGAYTGTSAAGFTLNPGSTDSLMVSIPFTPSAVGTYAFTMTTSSDFTDEEPTDNTSSGSFDVTNFIYARDNGTSDGGTFNSGESYEVGNIFDIFATEDLYAIDVKLNSTSGGSPLIYGKIYSIDASTGDFIFLETTDDYTITTSQISSQATLTLVLNAPVSVTAGESYLVVVGAYGDGGATNDLVTSTAGESEDQTTFYFDGTDQTWYYTTSTPMVRMNFDPSIGVKEITEAGLRLGQNSPNPFDNTSSINFELSSSNDVTFTITDVMGKIVEVRDLGTLAAGNHSIILDAASYSNGIYYYTMTAGSHQLTNKMIIKK